MAPPPLLKWKVLSKTQLTHDVFELKLERPEGFTGFRGGQYLSVVVPGAGPGGRNLRRAYSIASPPEWPEIELCIKLVEKGPGTNYLNSLNAGDTLEAQAPFGTFYLEHDQTKPALFIGTGTGIAPLRSMLLANEWTSKAPLGFLLGVRHEQDILYPELFAQDRKAPFAGHKDVIIALSRPSEKWTGFKGRVTDYLRQMSWDFSQTHYYLCGSGAMLTEVKTFLCEKNGVDPDQIHTEKYY